MAGERVIFKTYGLPASLRCAIIGLAPGRPVVRYWPPVTIREEMTHRVGQNFLLGVAMAVSKLQDDRLDMGVPVKERWERFCGRMVESRNKLHAYRTAFVFDRKATARWIEEQADKALADPEIAARIQAIKDAAAEQLLISVRDLMQDDCDIVAADPNELVSYVVENCRFCRGENHAYQWKSADEWQAEFDRITKRNASLPAGVQPDPVPDIAGGFGFDPTLDPVPYCPACFGQGTGRTVIHDTRKLSRQASKLYAGVKETTSGIEVKMHDKDKARERLMRALGAFKDGVPAIPVVPVKDAAAKPATVEEAEKAYLAMLGGNNVVPFKRG